MLAGFAYLKGLALESMEDDDVVRWYKEDIKLDPWCVEALTRILGRLDPLGEV